MKPTGPLIIDVPGHYLSPQDRQVLLHHAVGGVILFSRNYKSIDQLRSLCRSIRELRPELLITVDYEGGRVQRFRDGFTPIPPMNLLGQLYEQDVERALQLAEATGSIIAAELSEFDIDMPLTPVVDLDYGRCAVIGDRAFSTNPATVLALALAVQRGLTRGGMGATAKHFPGHGAVVEDSHHELPEDSRELEQMRLDMMPYRGLITQGLASVMMAHIHYPAVDALPASLSPTWIKTILREQMGFAGAVFCDDLSMGGAAVLGGYRERAHAALEAGCDLLPVCNNRDAVVELLDGFDHPLALAGAQRRALLARRRSTEDPVDSATLDTYKAGLLELTRLS